MENYRCVTSVQEIQQYISNAAVVAFDYETAPNEPYRMEEKAALDPQKNHMTGCSFSVKEHTGIYVPVAHKVGENVELTSFLQFLRAFLMDKRIVKVAHNIAFESAISYHQNIVIQPPVYDTICAAQMTLKSNYAFRKLADSGLKKLAEELCQERLPTFSDVTNGRHFDELDAQDMGKLLGLKKTDRYWLVHKNVFESKEIAGKIRINIASFEKWYANQIKYHKVTGEEPGKELKSWSYSVKEVADLLGVDEYLVYDLLKKNQMEAVIVDYWKRIPKESFQNWYKSQSRYRTKEDRKKDALLEDATITMPEMAQLLGTTRSAVYTILDNPKYSHFFEFIVIAEKKRITKESFQKFLEGQDRYKLDPSNDYEELAQEQNIALANFRRKKLSQTGIRGSNGNIKYLTFDEASYLAKVSRSMINKWADKGKFTVIKVGSRVRIRRDEFEDWMEQRDLERSMQ